MSTTFALTFKLIAISVLPSRLLLKDIVDYLPIIFVTLIFRSVRYDSLHYDSACFIQPFQVEEFSQVCFRNIIQQLPYGEVKEWRSELPNLREIKEHILVVAQMPYDRIMEPLTIFGHNATSPYSLANNQSHTSLLNLEIRLENDRAFHRSSA